MVLLSSVFRGRTMKCMCQTGTGYWIKAQSRPLTPKEEAWALQVAGARAASWRRGQPDKVYGEVVPRKTEVEALRMDILGARAELAWCVSEGIEWNASVDTYKRIPDAPPDVEIRARMFRHPSLIIRPDDLKLERYAKRRYVAARDMGDGSFEFNGWIFGWEAREHFRHYYKTHDNRPPAYFIPVKELHRLPFYRGRKRHEHTA